MSQPDFMHRPPQADSVTAYDEAHFVTYLRLLDAAADGAAWEEIARVVFGVDPSAEAEQAKAMYDSHLERARWMARSGYKKIAIRD
tara:strand:- start:974 stop:1231 length:258 start_codon:yes stop_codon:yes gene_type:complete